MAIRFAVTTIHTVNSSGMSKRNTNDQSQLNGPDDRRFFLALSRSGSLKEAAQTIGVNQSTFDRRNQQYESEPGVKLFERSSQGHELTPAHPQNMPAY